MDGTTPPPAHHWIEGPPVTLPDGRETIARCAQCGAPFVPSSRMHRHCSPLCRARWKQRTPAGLDRSRRGSATYATVHHSYRLARRALRRAGIDPRTVPALETLRGAGHVEGWREIVGLPGESRGRRRADTSEPEPDPPRASPAPWGAPVGAQPDHVAWGVSLGGIPGSTPARLVHGLVSRLIGEDHTQVARWALAMPSGAHGSGWGVVLFRRADAERLACRVERARTGSREHDLSTGPVIRLRAPEMLAPGRYRVTVDAVTPVSHLVDGRTRAITTPTAQTILGALGDVSQRLGLSVGRMHVASVACTTSTDRVTFGGHMGSVPGWVGRVTVECNAPAAWLLLCARHAGFGGRVAFGMGRVRVTAERIDDA